MKKFLFFSLLIFLGFSFNMPTKVYARRGGGFGGGLVGGMMGGMIGSALTRPSSSSGASKWRDYAKNLEDDLRRLRNENDDLRRDIRRLKDEIYDLEREIRKLKE